MATISAVILKSNKKKDGTYNVNIRIWHRNKPKYIPTEHWVTSKQVKTNGTIKDPIIIKLMNPVLDEYRCRISQLGKRVSHFDADGLAKWLISGEQRGADEINLIEFGENKVKELKAEKRLASAANMVTVLNSLKDYFNSEVVPVTEISANMLRSYEKYLKGSRTITRLNQFGNPVKREMQGLTETGLHNHMRDLKILFNNIRDHYNDEDKGEVLVKHYPFNKYKVKDAPASEKRKLNVQQLIDIRDCKVIPESREEQARDLFMLSFYLCGMNARDLWELSSECINEDRISYNRAKTRGRRKDKAFISISISKEIRPLLEKYAGILQIKYCNHNSLDRALSIGMAKISEKVGIANLEFYDARHAFGDLARNKCRFSKDDVALALNHVDTANKVTDIYISRDWSIVDEVQAKVLRLLDTSGGVERELPNSTMKSERRFLRVV